MMRFYTTQHRFYAGIDLHARTMRVCILDHQGTVVFDRNLPCHFPTLLQALAPYRDDIVLGVECMFGWYWLADRCAEHGIPFVVGHALYMRLIHGAKAKNDRIAHKIARLLKGGNFPRYRRRGLPTTSSLVESLVEDVNGPVKSKQKYWNRPDGAEAILQVRAAYLSEDDRLHRYFAQRPGNPYRRRVA
jgi:hypothetical protein